MASATTKKVIYIENVGDVTHRQLADHLVYGTKWSWRRLKVVFLHSKMRGDHPVCAAVQVPCSMYETCWQKNNSVLRGGRLKMLPPDFRLLQSVRWIRQPDGTKLSVVGNRHWALDAVKLAGSQVVVNDSIGGEVSSGFYMWDSIKLQGGEDFCYAAVDCGVSLADFEFTGDVDSVIERALQSGVQRFVLKGSSLNMAERAKHLTSIYPDVMGYTVGYRPQLQTKEWTEEKLSALRDLAAEQACVAVGECGLDLSSPLANLKFKQKPMFLDQLKLAQDLGKPVLVYERDAKESLLEILTEHKCGLPPLAVCSESPDKDFVDLLTRNGHYVIVTGAWWSWQRGAGANTALHAWLSEAEQWQLDRLLLASNAPCAFPDFVTIVVLSEFQRAVNHVSLHDFPSSGLELFKKWCSRKRNDPCCVPVLIELLARTVKIPPKDVAGILLENSKRFFKVEPRSKEPVGKEGESVRNEGGSVSWKGEQIRFWLPWTLSIVVIYYVVWLLCDLVQKFFVT